MRPLFASLLCALLLLGSGATWAASPVKLIFDTDIASDVDDVGAVAVLHALADRGEVEPLAMGVSTRFEWSAPCLDALNTYYGRPDIPIGVVKNSGVQTGSRYALALSVEYPHDLRSPADAPDAAMLYRKVLAGQKDHEVVIVSVGFLTNIANLLKSEPDEYSPLNGVELVARKVKLWVCMGGRFPHGQEWNLYKDSTASKYAIDNFPRPIVFSGWEIGNRIMTGEALRHTPQNNPVRRAYELYNGLRNRQSWDQTAVLFAIRGLGSNQSTLWDSNNTGYCHVDHDGTTAWRHSPDKNHTYLILRKPYRTLTNVIEDLMTRLPNRR